MWCRAAEALNLVFRRVELVILRSISSPLDTYINKMGEGTHKINYTYI